ncbi:acyl-CoA thioesterase [bacterium CPR1]|nr:acyl-CoA thioesterase [bacterium CPR1]
MDGEFGFQHPVEVRFRDLDALGHVNHASFLTYFEIARTAYWMQLTGIRSVAALDFILARVECDYRNSISFPETLVVGVRCSKLGTRSFDLEYRALRGDGQVAALGRTVQVAYDYTTGQTRPIQLEVRSLLTRDLTPGAVGADAPGSEPGTTKLRERN